MLSDDLRHAFHRLRSKPAPIVAAVMMLGLGVIDPVRLLRED